MGVWRSVVSRLKLWAPDDTRAPAENGRCDNRSMDDLAGTHETSTNSGPVYLLRNRGQFVKGGALVAFSLFIFISSVIDPAPGSLLAPTLIALGIVGLATAFFFLPRLIVDGQGLHVINWLRTIEVPWNSYHYLSDRFGLEIITDDGARSPIACFPGPGGISAGRDKLGGPRAAGVNADVVGHSMRHARRHPAGRASTPEQMIPVYASGTHKRWGGLPMAYSLIERIAPEMQANSPVRRRREAEASTHLDLNSDLKERITEGGRQVSVNIMNAAVMAVSIVTLGTGIWLVIG